MNLNLPVNIGRLLKHSATPLLLGAGVAFGFARDLLLAHEFGLSRELDIFRAASLLPTIFTQTVGVAFVFALVPYLTSNQAKTSRPEIERVRNGFAATLICCVILTLVGLLTIIPQSHFLGLGMTENEIQLISRNMYFTWTVLPILGISFAIRAYLYCLDKPFAGAAAPAVQSGIFAFLMLVVAGFNNNVEMTSRQAVLIYLASAVPILILHFFVLDADDRKQLKEALMTKRVPLFSNAGLLFWAIATSILYQVLLAGPRVVDQHFMSALPAGSIAATEFAHSVSLALTMLVATSYNIIFLARFNRAMNLKAKLGPHFKRAIALSVAVGSFGILISFFSDKLLQLVFWPSGIDFAEIQLISEVFGWQIMALGFLVFNTIAAQMILSMNALKLLIGVVTIKLIVKYIAMLLLVPVFGLAASGITLLLGEILMTIAFAFSLFFISPEIPPDVSNPTP